MFEVVKVVNIKSDWLHFKVASFGFGHVIVRYDCIIGSSRIEKRA